MFARLWLGRTLVRAQPSLGDGEQYILQAIEMAEERKERPAMAQGNYFLGQMHAIRGEKEKALEHLSRAKEMFQKMGMDYWLTQAQAALSKLEAET